MAQSGLQIGDYTIQRSLIGVLILDIQRPSRIKFSKMIWYGTAIISYQDFLTLYISRGERDFNGITLSYDDLEQGLQKWKKSNRCRSDKWFNPHIEQTYDTDLPEGILFPYFCYFTLDLLESRYLVRSRLHPSFELKGFLWGSKGSMGFYGKIPWDKCVYSSIQKPSHLNSG